MDIGHARSQNKTADGVAFATGVNVVRPLPEGRRRGTGLDAEALTTPARPGTSGGPYDGEQLEPPSRPARSASQSAAAQTIVPACTGEDRPTGIEFAFDPIAAAGACARSPSTDQAGVANYRLGAAPARASP